MALIADGWGGWTEQGNEGAMNAVSIQNSSYATLSPRMEFTKRQHDKSLGILCNWIFTVVDFNQIFDFQEP